MVWAKIDDEILDNPKIVRAGVFGFALHVAAITWCCRNLTDGFIPTARVTALLTLDRVEYDVANPLALIDGPDSGGGNTGLPALVIADHLVKVGLWDDVEGGFQLHDFLQFNPSRADVEAKREQNAARAKRSRTQHATGGASHAASHGVTHALRAPLPVPDPLNKSPDGDLYGAQSAPPKSGTRIPTRRKQGTALPDDWSPGDSLQAWARSKGFDATGPELAKFRDHWKSRGKTMVDWDAAYRNWLRNASDWARPKSVRPADITRQPVTDDLLARWTGES